MSCFQSHVSTRTSATRHWLSRKPSCTNKAISRILSRNSFRRLGHQLHVYFHSQFVEREFWKDGSVGVTSCVIWSLSSASVITLITRGSGGQTTQSITSKYSTASNLSFAGTLNLHIFPLWSADLAFITRRRLSSHMRG